MNKQEKTYCKIIGKTIRNERIKHKKSVRLFAYENDIPQATLSRVERGDGEVRIITLKKIAEGLGISISEMFKLIEKELPNNFKIFEDEHY